MSEQVRGQSCPECGAPDDMKLADGSLRCGPCYYKAGWAARWGVTDQQRREFTDLIESRVKAAEQAMAAQIARDIYGPSTEPVGVEVYKRPARRFWRMIPVRWLLAREWAARKILRVDLLSDHECDL